MNSIAYIRYSGSHDDEQTLVTLYTYNLYSKLSYDVYIICESVSEKVKEAILSINSNVKFIQPGKDCKLLLTGEKECYDITGVVYSKHVKYDEHQDITTDVFKPKLAVVCYVFYPQYYQEMYNHVNSLSENLNTKIDLYVYFCDVNSANDMKRILKNQTPNSKVNVILTSTKNTGRDVRSFLMFIKQKHYKQYDYICKIHTKKTTYLHDNWRQTYLQLLLEPPEYKAHEHKLKVKPNVISSVEKFRVHEKHIHTNVNYSYLEQLNKKFKLGLNFNCSFSFFAGTMFWCTKDYCNILDKVVSESDIYKFEPEPIKNDGSLAHAWERAFCLLR